MLLQTLARAMAGGESPTTSPSARCAASLSDVATGCSLAPRAGGERADAPYNVIQTCKANDVDPQAYIADVIAKVAADEVASRWEELMPWNWEPDTAQPRGQAA